MFLMTLRIILKPYPNLSSFLFDHQFWTSSGSKSRKDRDALRDVIIREDFEPSDLKGVNFDAIEKDLRQTGGSGWRETLLTIRVPKGIKLTKAKKRADAAEQSQLRRGEPSTVMLERPVPSAPITVSGFQHRKICDIIREMFSSDPAANNFHCHDFHLYTHFLLSSKRPNTCSNHDMAFSYLIFSHLKVTPSRRGKQIVLEYRQRTIY